MKIFICKSLIDWFLPSSMHFPPHSMNPSSQWHLHFVLSKYWFSPQSNKINIKLMFSFYLFMNNLYLPVQDMQTPLHFSSPGRHMHLHNFLFNISSGAQSDSRINKNVMLSITNYEIKNNRYVIQIFLSILYWCVCAMRKHTYITRNKIFTFEFA